MYVGIDVGERFAMGMSAFHRPSGMLKKIDIKMTALNRPVRQFRDLLESKKDKRPDVCDLELEMGQVKPNQLLEPTAQKDDVFDDLVKMVS